MGRSHLVTHYQANFHAHAFGTGFDFGERELTNGAFKCQSTLSGVNPKYAFTPRNRRPDWRGIS
jgi:hypothetical protein